MCSGENSCIVRPLTDEKRLSQSIVLLEAQFMSPQLPLYFLGMNPLGVEHREIIFYSYLIVLLFNFIVIVVATNYWEESGGDWGGRGGRRKGLGEGPV